MVTPALPAHYGDGNDSPSTHRQRHTRRWSTTISGINNLTSLGGIATNGTITTTGANLLKVMQHLSGTPHSSDQVPHLQEHLTGKAMTSPSTTRPQPQSQVHWQRKQLYICWRRPAKHHRLRNDWQPEQGNVTLTGDTMLKGTSGSFEKGLDGANKSLTLYYSNTTTIDGNSVFNNLNDLTSYGPVELGGTIQTAGNQSYLDTATLINTTEIQADGGS